MTDEMFRWATRHLVTVGFSYGDSETERQFVNSVWPTSFAQRCRAILAERDALKGVVDATPEVRAVMYFELSRQAKRLWFMFGACCGGFLVAALWTVTA